MSPVIRRLSIPGYHYDHERQAAHDAVIGRLPKEYWPELPTPIQVLFALAVISRNPDKYLEIDGYIKNALGSTIIQILGLKGRPPRASGWVKVAQNRGWVESDGGSNANVRFRILTDQEDLCSVLEDLALYYQDPDALTPDDWAALRARAEELCEEPLIDGNSKRAAALGSLLAHMAGACQP